MSVKATCGCGKVTYYVHSEGEDREYASLCETCFYNGGDYTSSPNWVKSQLEKQYFDDKKKSHKR